MNLLKGRITKKQVYRLSIQILFILIGTFIMSFGYMVFLSPNNILPGGFMGLARIVHDVLAKVNFTFISTSLWYIILNIFLYLYAVKVLGLEFGIRAGVGIFSYSFFTSLMEDMSLVTKIINKLQTESEFFSGGVYILYSIYGGIIMGIGIGIIFRAEGSTGGCDMVAIVVNKFFPNVTTGQIVICVDGFVCLISLFTYGSVMLPLFALIAIFTMGKISDMFVDGVKSVSAYYILTEKKEEITERIFKEIKHGVTYIKCEGMFTRREKSMLLVLLRQPQIMKLKKIVKEVDPNSFMFGHSVSSAYGQGFLSYETVKPKSKIITKATDFTNKIFAKKEMTKVKKDKNIDSLKDSNINTENQKTSTQNDNVTSNIKTDMNNSEIKNNDEL